MGGDSPTNPPAEQTGRIIQGGIVEYQYGRGIPSHVVDLIQTHFAIEQEDARSAGMLGFMARALVVATMPYKDPKADVFKRQNGDFRLRIIAGYEGGIPYGIYPRLLMNWLTTEAVRTGDPTIRLGDSLTTFMREIMEVRSITGGRNGTGTRIVEQMKRLFGSMITATYVDENASASERRGFAIKNVVIADELRLAEESGDSLWTPQRAEEAGRWQSSITLNESFFREIIDRPVPVDLRAYKALRNSPLAMDLYTWLTYRMSYIKKPSAPIPWKGLMGQFGSGFTPDFDRLDKSKQDQVVRDFKKNFLKALKQVHTVYPLARVESREHGLIVRPSPTHVAKAIVAAPPTPKQGSLL